MALPEAQMREIRLELYEHIKVVADKIEATGKASRQEALAVASELGQARTNLQGFLRNAITMAMESRGWDWDDGDSERDIMLTGSILA